MKAIPAGVAPPPPGHASAARRLRGIVLMSLAVLCFAALDAMAKLLTRHYPVAAVVWARYAVHMLLLLVMFGPRLRGRLLQTARPGAQTLRALLLLATTLLFVSGLGYIPLAEATAINYLTPLIVTGLSVPLLGERVGRPQWLAMLAGFIGVLVIVRPGGALMTPAVLLPFSAAICNSLYQIVTRKLSSTETPVVTNFITGLVGTLVMSVTLPWSWHTPTLPHALLMVGAGVAGLCGHYLLTRAFECTTPAVVAPFSYGQILWAVLLGFAVFGTLPDAASFAGIGIIAASGLYLARRHRAQARSEARPR
ncbi:drug/metabolite transporter (DMT)-like permease [Plasticicumulans lactativorans]|uniref:Drug/metabolite transporter (DMT)-like permease n=1 Tax=Plasticicumulans lactativorans TaxID=1133106 RepID=A0A4R2LA43_9GAMM|nr:drug/metabolite transporter (DMT)-like permease [Plasticicumulans lactativorans]